jgi:hypothetical protein
MVVLCDGMLRSGSTWSFNVALNLIRRCDQNRKTFGFFNEDPAVLVAAARPRASHLVIKSHKLDLSAYELCRTRRIQAIYTWRHPYDVVVSSMRIFGRSVDHWIGAIRNTLRIWSFHRETGDACIIPYETIVQEPSAGIERIASYLGLRVGPEEVSEIAYQVSLEQLKDFSRHIDELEPSRVVRKDGCCYDRETLLHKNHIVDGGVGYGAKVLDCGQLLAIDAMLREERFDFLCQSATRVLQAHSPARPQVSAPLEPLAMLPIRVGN